MKWMKPKLNGLKLWVPLKIPYKWNSWTTLKTVLSGTFTREGDGEGGFCPGDL